MSQQLIVNFFRQRKNKKYPSRVIAEKIGRSVSGTQRSLRQMKKHGEIVYEVRYDKEVSTECYFYCLDENIFRKG